MSRMKLLTPKEVAEFLKLNILTVYEYMRSGKILAIKLGRNYRILDSDLKDFIKNHRLNIEEDGTNIK